MMALTCAEAEAAGHRALAAASAEAKAALQERVAVTTALTRARNGASTIGARALRSFEFGSGWRRSRMLTDNSSELEAVQAALNRAAALCDASLPAGDGEPWPTTADEQSLRAARATLVELRQAREAMEALLGESD